MFIQVSEGGGVTVGDGVTVSLGFIDEDGILLGINEGFSVGVVIGL